MTRPFSSLAWIASGLLLCAPAFYNRFPLLYSDSVEYVKTGPRIARWVVLGQPTGFLGQRSIFYSTFTWSLHQERSLWPIVLVQGLLAAGVLWACCRAVLPRCDGRHALGIVAGLTLATTLPWYCSLVMPDVFAGLLILATFLLACGDRSRGAIRRTGLLLLVGLSILVHTSHLLIAFALLGALSAWDLWNRAWRRHRLPASGGLGGALAGSLLALLAGNFVVHGRPSLTGPHPPFLLARVIGDGTAELYLNQRCRTQSYAVCDLRDRFAGTRDDFLWDVVPNLPAETRDRIREEETRIVLGTVLSHPWLQLEASAGNVVRQLFSFRLHTIGPRPFIERNVDRPPLSGYLGSLQHRNRLPLGRLRSLQFGFVWLCGIVCIALLATRTTRSSRLPGLGAVIAVGLGANALVTGVLSVPNQRYGARVAWLVPFLAGLAALSAWQHRRGRIERP